MKRFTLILTAVAAILAASCASSSLPGVALGLAAPALSGGAGAVASSAATMDFKKDEVLCLYGDDDPVNGQYHLARVLTPASPATKNQAEVVYVEDGKKAWSARVLSSRKAEKMDFEIGSTVLYPSGWSGYEKMDQDQYRFTTWNIGRVTNNDELFKGMVEVGGQKYGVKILRVATVAIE